MARRRIGMRRAFHLVNLFRSFVMRRVSLALSVAAAALAFAACSPKPTEPAVKDAPATDVVEEGSVEAPSDEAAVGEARPEGVPEGPGRGRGRGMDGPATLADMQARAERRFERMDADSDGVLVGDELEGGRGGGRMMERADANGDSRVTRAEAAAASQAAFRAMDANGDGTVTEEERPERGPR